MMRLNINNRELPGVQGERTIRMGSEITRQDVFLNGDYIGQIVYVLRNTARGTLYGWRPAGVPAQSRLTHKTGAVRLLMLARPYL
jgi:hypothetical protein